MNIWCPEEVYDIVIKRIDICKSILSQKPEFYTEKDFREKTKREIEEKAMTIPILINTTEEDYNKIMESKKNKRYDLKIIYNIICKYDKKIAQDIKDNKLDQQSCPGIDKKKSDKSSYEKNIIPIINAIKEKKKWSLNIKKTNKDKDVYQLYFDSKNKKIYVSFYYGTRKIN